MLRCKWEVGFEIRQGYSGASIVLVIYIELNLRSIDHLQSGESGESGLCNCVDQQPHADILSTSRNCNLKALDCIIDLGGVASGFAGPGLKTVTAAKVYPLLSVGMAQDFVSITWRRLFVNDPAARLFSQEG